MLELAVLIARTAAKLLVDIATVTRASHRVRFAAAAVLGAIEKRVDISLPAAMLLRRRYMDFKATHE